MQTVFIRNITGDIQAKMKTEVQNAPGFISIADFPEKENPAKLMLFCKLQDAKLSDFKNFLQTKFSDVEIQEGTTL